jgi:hypothetical protein
VVREASFGSASKDPIPPGLLVARPNPGAPPYLSKNSEFLPGCDIRRQGDESGPGSSGSSLKLSSVPQRISNEPAVIFVPKAMLWIFPERGTGMEPAESKNRLS